MSVSTREITVALGACLLHLPFKQFFAQYNFCNALRSAPDSNGKPAVAGLRDVWLCGADNGRHRKAIQPLGVL
ncbi:MAG: hypothetical protein ACXITV_08995 [Luteibaculaceae bacterium]